MQFRLLQCLAKAVAKHGGKFLFSLVPGGEAVYDIAADALEDYRRASQEGALRAELQALAQAPPEQVRQEVQAAVQAEAAGLPPDAQQTMAAYLTQVPATIRRSLRRPSDSTGTTVPASLPLSRPEDLIPFLPSRPPRFKPGDRPLPGVDWVLDELIGIGGFGEVWKAYHAHLKSKPPVALKFCLDPAALPALRNEAGLLDRVIQHGRHPGIVALLQTYLSAAPPCLEYEYIEGGDLAALIQELHARGRMRPGTANGLMLHLAGIVASAHRANPPIVHGDLKPANVLVQRDESGKVKLRVIDYGIGGLAAARAARETKQKTRTRQELLTDAVRGAYTPLYASPQQMTRGQGEPADPRDDVHALGVIWLQLLTGDLGMISVPPDWREQVEERGLNEGLVKLLASCIASKPDKRPANGLVLVEQIKATLVANERRKPEGGQEREERRQRPRSEGETGQTRALPVSGYLNKEDSPTVAPAPQPGEARSATSQPKRNSRLVRSTPRQTLQGAPGGPRHTRWWAWVAGLGAAFALGVILLAAHLTRPKEPDLVEYTSEEGRFAVRVPGTPRVSKKKTAAGETVLATVEQPNGRYVVAYLDLQTELGQDAAKAQERLEKARDGAVSSVGGKVLADQPITLAGKYPGRDVTIELPGKEDLARDRMYLVNGRLYQVTATGRKWWVESADTRKFLDSFRLRE
jgi:serine/threonine protein kinase